MNADPESTSIFYRKFPPVQQALSVGALAFLVMLITKWVDSGNPKAWQDEWTVVIAFLLFYSVTNCVFALGAQIKASILTEASWHMPGWQRDYC